MAVDKVNEPQSGYISIEEAAVELSVSRTNLYYYIGQLNIEPPTRFPLDRRSYIRRSDLERIKVARGAAATSTRITSDDVLVFLAGLGLAVTPHSDPSYGWGYAWFSGDWEGPYPTPVDTIRAAFETADKKAQHLRDMPFPTRAGELYWWDGEEWFGARHKEGELQIRTFNQKENDGYEPVQAVIERRDPWLHPAPPTGDDQADEERERARLAALWLTAGLRELQYKVDEIGWQNEGLHAEVVVNDHSLGDLLTVYNRFRKDGFLAWLRTKLSR
jgi:hypothetical protein